MQTSIPSSLSHKLANMGFVCACLVAFIHVQVPSMLKCIIGSGISLLAVPFFFIASGYFLGGHLREKQWYGTELSKRVQSLLIPFLIWTMVKVLYVFLILLLGMISHIGMQKLQVMPASFPDWCMTFGLDPFQMPRLQPLWFLRALFILCLLSPVLFWPLQRSHRLGFCYIFGFWCAWWLCSTFISFSTPWRNFLLYTLSMDGIVYFSIGCYLRLHEVFFRVPRPIACAFILIVFLLVIDFATGNHLALSFDGQQSLLRFLLPLLILSVWTLVPPTPWPQWLTRAAFPIFLVHMLILSALDNLFTLIPTLNPALLGAELDYFLCGLLSILLSIAFAVLLRRLFPKLAAVLFGGR